MDMLDLIDFSQPSLWLAVAWIVIHPALWNIIGFFEYRYHPMTKLTGDKHRAVFLMMCIIQASNSIRGSSYRHALTQQPKWDVLESIPYLEQLSWLVLAFGMTLVCSSMYALGWKNTFMGDYFGVLLDARVTGFPFNMFRDPMYLGTTINFIAGAIAHASFAGLVLSGWVWINYMIALRIETPFTAKIYADREASKAKSQ